MKDIERLNGEKIEGKPKKKRNDGPDYAGMISSALDMLGVDHVREYKFLHDRRFRFDIAIPGEMVAVEFEGGVFTSGRHTRGKGYSRDAKKYNLAVRHGWRLFRYTTADTNKINWEFEVADEIKRLIKNPNRFANKPIAEIEN